jgi:hypothetical protein
MRARALFLCGAVLVSGCSLIYASDLDDAREIVILPEGGRSDSSGDGGAVDGGVTDTGTLDAPSGEAAAPKGCAAYQPAPKFCADFDDNAGLAGWELQTDDGQSVVQSEQFFSSPSSAKVVAKATTTTCLYSRFERYFENIGSKRVTVAFRMRLVSPWPNGGIPFVLDLHPSSGDNAFCAALYFVGSGPNGKIEGANIDVQSNVQDDHQIDLNGFPSSDEWSEMKVTVTPNPSGGSTYETTFTGPNGFSVSNRQDFPECPAWGRMGVHFGTHCDHRDATMFFDDIRIDWE